MEEGTKMLKGEKDEQLIIAGTPTICIKMPPKIVRSFHLSN
ncbi:hypothetical protein [Ferviditalea candida]|uniref:Uncharacterized protein n=1 Tax=Ferviditalea candida TaxID=3108399 RepID=A0ABU5ZIU8_9BACL|nr:hypothetical protein [Paenibacillaceae bacterium T2]